MNNLPVKNYYNDFNAVPFFVGRFCYWGLGGSFVLTEFFYLFSNYICFLMKLIITY